LETGFIHFEYNHDKLQSLGTVPSTAQVVHLDQLLQQLLLSTGSSSNPTRINWINSSSWSNQTARLTRLLNSSSNCLLWAGTRPAFELSLDSWSASYCSARDLNSNFSEAEVSGLKCSRVDRKEITDCHRRWSALLTRYCEKANTQRPSQPRIRAHVS
jgi:hypothetical protein